MFYYIRNIFEEFLQKLQKKIIQGPLSSFHKMEDSISSVVIKILSYRLKNLLLYIIEGLIMQCLTLIG